MGLALGSIIGSLGSGVLLDAYAPHNYWPPYLFISAMFLVFTACTVFGITEIPRPVEKPFEWSDVWRMFVLDPKAYRNFYWVIVTRCFYDMGVYSILPFLSYYYKGM